MDQDQAEKGVLRAGVPGATGPDAPGCIRFETVTKRFAGIAAVEEVSLEICEGEFFALLGPSGCGKTTLLRLLAGFETPDEGAIYLAGRDLSGVPAYRRPVNTMFQHYALFPHLTVEGNVAFGLRYDGLSRDQAASRVKEMLALVRLEGFEKRKPGQLSGGQRQRVALARALAKRPKALLLDEPLAALDRKLRESTQSELARLHRELGATFLIVTHDQDEAMTLAGRIAVMESGRIVQVGTPREVYERPASRYVADFVGAVNLIEGRLLESKAGCSIIAARGLQFVSSQTVEVAPDAAVWLAVRPENVVLSQAPPSDAVNVFPGSLIDQAYRGEASAYTVRLDGGIALRAVIPNAAGAAAIDVGRRVWASFAPEAAIVLLH